MRPVGGAKHLSTGAAMPLEGRSGAGRSRAPVGVDRRSVRRWNAAYRKREVPVSRRDRCRVVHQMTARQRGHLETLLLRGAAASVSRGSVDVSARRARDRPAIRDSLPRRSHRRLLRSLGWTPQRPSARLGAGRGRNSSLGSSDWPRIKKSHRLSAWLVYRRKRAAAVAVCDALGSARTDAGALAHRVTAGSFG